MKKKFLLGIVMFVSALCFAQTKTVDTRSFVFSDINKSTKTDSAITLSTVKAQKGKASATAEIVERMDSIVGIIAGSGVVDSKEVWTYNEKNYVTSSINYGLDYVSVGGGTQQMMIEFEKCEYEYDSRGYVIKDNKRTLLNPFTNLYVEGMQNRYVVDVNGNISEQYIDLYNPATGAWDNTTYTQYRIDETNKDSVFLEGTISVWNVATQQYDIVAKSERHYDSHGNMIVKADYEYNAGKWIGFSRGRVDHRYDYTKDKEEDIISMEKVYDWDNANGTWVPLVAVYLTFNSLGNLTANNEYRYVSANDSTHTKRETITYLDREGIIKDFYLVSGLIEWFSTEKNEFVWRMKDEYNYTFSNDTVYSYGTRTEHVTGTWSEVGGVATFVWSNSSQWKQEDRNRIWIDYVGKNLIHLKEYAYAVGTWYSGGKFTFSHDEKGRETEWIEYSEISYDRWVPAGRITTEFNDDDKVLKSENYSYSGGVWVYSGGTENEYDISGTKIHSRIYRYDVLSGKTVGTSGTDFLFDYNIPASKIVYPYEGLHYKLLSMQEMSYDSEGWYASKEYIAYYTEVEKYSSAPSVSTANASAYISNNVLYVDSSIAETINVYSTTGSLVFSTQKAEGKATFNLTNLPTGLYVIKGVNWTIKSVK
jgi:hypothetical protein